MYSKSHAGTYPETCGLSFFFLCTQKGGNPQKQDTHFVLLLGCFLMSGDMAMLAMNDSKWRHPGWLAVAPDRHLPFSHLWLSTTSKCSGLVHPLRAGSVSKNANTSRANLCNQEMSTAMFQCWSHCDFNQPIFHTWAVSPTLRNLHNRAVSYTCPSLKLLECLTQMSKQNKCISAIAKRMIRRLHARMEPLTEQI